MKFLQNNLLFSHLKLLRLEVLPIGTGIVLFSGYLTQLSFTKIFLLIIAGAIGLHAAINSIAEVVDQQLDVGKESGLVKGVIRPKTAIMQGLLVLFISLSIIFLFFNLTAFFLSLGIMLISALYALPPVHLKNHGFFGTLGVTLPFSLLFLIPFIEQKAALNMNFLFWFIVIAVNTFVGLSCKDFKDYNNERKMKILTPPQLVDPFVLGKIIAILSWLPSLLLLLGIYLSIVSLSFVWVVFIMGGLKILYGRMLLSDPIKSGKMLFTLSIIDISLFPYLLLLFWSF